MNWAHLHLILNHFPILGAVLVTVGLGLAFLKKDRQLMTLSFQVMILVGILTLPAYFTGEPAEEMIEHLPGFSKDLIEKHEDASFFGLIATEVLAVAGMVGLVLLRQRKEALTRNLLMPMILVSALNIVLMAWIANLGGEIRHTEIRDGFSAINGSRHAD